MIKKVKDLMRVLFKNQKYELVDKNSWLPFFNYEEYFGKYIESLEKTNQFKTDNFSKNLRMYSLIQLVDYILKKKQFINNSNFNFVECGCWKGTSTYLVSSLLKENNFRGKFYVFDSFEGGLSKLSDEDFIKSQSIINIKKNKNIRENFASSEKEVKKVLNKFEFVEIFKGWIPERFNEVSSKKFNFIHIDVDLYKPTLDSIKFFFPRLEKNGIMICDDYNSTDFPGAKKAWDEYFSLKKDDLSFYFEGPFGSVFLIK